GGNFTIGKRDREEERRMPAVLCLLLLLLAQLVACDTVEEKIDTLGVKILEPLITPAVIPPKSPFELAAFWRQTISALRYAQDSQGARFDLWKEREALLNEWNEKQAELWFWQRSSKTFEPVSKPEIIALVELEDEYIEASILTLWTIWIACVAAAGVMGACSLMLCNCNRIANKRLKRERQTNKELQDEKKEW